MNCIRCGMPFQPDERETLLHRNCDESFPEETWVDEEAKIARAGVLERRNRIQNGPPKSEWYPKFLESIKRIKK